MNFTRGKAGLLILYSVIVLTAGGSIAAGQESGLPQAATRPYGFLGPEIYKFDFQIRQLKPVDANADGKTDLAVVNNRKARIEFLLQATPGEEVKPEPDASDTINVVYDDSGYRKKSVISDQEVSGIAFSDFNGDGRTDMACFGDPSEIRVYFQDKEGNLGNRIDLPAEEGIRTIDGLTAGDVNGDGKTDLLLTGNNALLVYLQTEPGKFGEPKRLPADLAGVMGPRMCDVNQDGREDLLVVKPDDNESFRWRQQSTEGFLGPELRCELPAIRSLEPADLDRDGHLEFLVVQKQSGRVRLLRLGERPDGPSGLGSPERYHLTATKDANLRAFALADLDGDGRTDLIATDPGSGILLFFRQSETGGLLPAQTFPAPAGSSDLKAADLDGDGRTELYVLSAEEGTVGVADYEERGRISFPRALPLPFRPQAIDLGDLSGDGKEELAVVGKNGDRYRLWTTDGAQSATRELSFQKASGDIKEMRIVDANQDGRADLMILIAFEPIRFLIQKENGDFADLSESPGYKQTELKDVEFSAFSETDADGDGKMDLLLCRKNFARAIRIAADGSVESIDQWNGRSPKSEIAAALTADLNLDGTPEMVLVDKSDWKLTVMTKTAQGLYEITENIDVGSLRFKGMGTGDLDSDGRPDVILFGQENFVVLRSGGKNPVLDEIAGWETDVKDGYYDKIAVGDFNGDGRKDVALTEATENSIDLLDYDSENLKFARLYKFRVFEQKTYGSDRFRGGPQPQEMIAADLTADGLDDLAVIVHDRVLVYPQDAIVEPK